MVDAPRSRPLLVASSGARDRAGLLADVRALPPEADLVEVRLDRFADPQGEDLPSLVRAIPRPAILTLRPRDHGGEFAGDAVARRAVLAAADAAGFSWVDVEEDLAASVPRGRARRIVSWHGSSAGGDGAARVRDLAGRDADVVKVAARIDDAAAALRFVKGATAARADDGPPVVAIAMGPAGRWLRPLAGRFRMPLLYAAMHPSRKTAEGQVTLADLLQIHRVLRIGPTTRVFAVAGADVAGSLSPAVHNEVFARLGLDAVYVDLQTPRWSEALAAARALPLAGLSVTAPFKQDALAAADDVEPEVAAIGAANTLVRDADRWRAANTDATGFLAALDLAMNDPAAAEDVCVGHTFDPLRALDAEAARHAGKGRIESALIYGTGGVARAVCRALRARGVRTWVTGRHQPSVTAFVMTQGGGVTGITPGRAASQKFDLLVKAVPDVPLDDLELDPFDFGRHGFAADVVYRPLDTEFLLACRRAGRIPIPGILMFAEQAVLQATAFTGATPAEVRPWIADALAAAFGL